MKPPLGHESAHREERTGVEGTRTGAGLIEAGDALVEDERGVDRESMGPVRGRILAAPASASERIHYPIYMVRLRAVSS